MLTDTKAKYQQLIALMKKSEEKMPPVLAKFHDNVLFLKHNLMPRRSAPCRDGGADRGDVQGLVKDMERALPRRMSS